MLKVVLVSNMPAPYREKVYEYVNENLEGQYNVIYCSEREADREWEFEYGKYMKTILSNIPKNARHNNPRIFKILNRLNPDILIITGFYPTMLYSYLWALFKRRKLIVFTDGTFISESSLSIIHKIVRKLVFIKTKAFIGPSNGAATLYESYGIDKQKFFRTYLSINNQMFFTTPLHQKEYDLMFSGQFITRKMPFFFIEVAKRVKEHYGRCKVLMLGNGPLKKDILKLLEEYKIDYNYPGFIPQKELPWYYSKSKLFLFPTLNDPWGVVVNEAMASGVPVITCTNAGVANDLVVHGVNGYILPLLEEKWADKIKEVFEGVSEYQTLCDNALNHIQKYNSENAANGIISSIKYVSTFV